MTARARRKANPGALAIFGNPRELSEGRAWERVEEMAGKLYGMATRADRGDSAAAIAMDVRQLAHEIGIVAENMKKQVRRGVHVNPRGKGECMSRNVQAIAYVHEQDGDAYVHGFGDAELNAAQLDKGILDLADLKELTDVCMYANPDGSLTLRHAQGKDLTALFD